MTAPLALNDRYRIESANVSGNDQTFDASTGSAPTGFTSTIIWGTNDLVPLLIYDTATNAWEVGLYDYQGSSVYDRGASSNSKFLASSTGTWVTFAATGTATIMCVSPAWLYNNLGIQYDATNDVVFVSPGHDVQAAAAFGSSVTSLTNITQVIQQYHSDRISERIIADLDTSDATPTAIATFDPDPDFVGGGLIYVKATVIATSNDLPFNDHKVMTLEGVAKDDGFGTVAVQGTASVTTVHNDNLATADIDLVASGGTVQLQVTGVAATALRWTAAIEVLNTRSGATPS